ncbi:MAG: hypothetical protein ACOY4Q_05515, partial [Bacillota bacterium]
LLQAAKTAKGAMVKYAMPNINRAAAAINKNPIGKAVVNQVKYQAGIQLGLFDAVKSTAKGLYKTGKYLLTTDPRQIGQDVRTAAGNIKQGFKNAINNPKQTMAAIKSGAINAGRAFVNADSMERGRIVGRIGGEIALAFAGTKGIDKLAKVAKGSQLLGRMGNAAKASRAGQILSSTSGQLKGLTRRLLVEETGSFDPFFRLGRKGTSKADFFVTEAGEAIPGTKKALRYNLSKMNRQGRKFYGNDSSGPLRVIIEKHKNNPNFKGSKNPLHEVPHLHIEMRANTTSGPWGHTSTIPMDLLD